jgi:hypothetical protein
MRPDNSRTNFPDQAYFLKSENQLLKGTVVFNQPVFQGEYRNQ